MYLPHHHRDCQQIEWRPWTLAWSSRNGRKSADVDAEITNLFDLGILVLEGEDNRGNQEDDQGQGQRTDSSRSHLTKKFS